MIDNTPQGKLARGTVFFVKAMAGAILILGMANWLQQCIDGR